MDLKRIVDAVSSTEQIAEEHMSTKKKWSSRATDADVEALMDLLR
jgi:hypothetical protein